ncbi:hypothetical protein [Mucilaginibacter ginsenosidivorax]|uniref:DUF4595 domain-containing protein n=1 Tax=Mucilaginibacter ginsenosidivorax TaxID=862126 RepID=A0A5B8VWU7_9SPHI|nr:hypothetical protein [Mucilaginibacter ginsenosidivorax]QEC76030.1 hypothetical protein FSB76_08750 [Mucilaginibacter ginsenosidivorax]
MKTHTKHIAFTTKQNIIKPLGQNGNGTISAKSLILYPFIFMLLVAFTGCGKPSNNPIPNVINISACAITSDVDQALGARNFEYDDKGLLTKMTGPNYYYGPFVRTITTSKVIDAYPSASVDGQGNHFYGNINITYSYSGGSGNIYDGNPQFLHQLFYSTISNSLMKTDSMFQFNYDDAKKHLTTVLAPGNGSQDALGFTLFRTELVFAYDANDNVSQVKIIYDYSKKTVVYPSGESRTDYIQKSDETLNITYDDKPSPYTAITKYWKFIGNDFGGYGAYNLDKLRFWLGRCAILSKNNPIKITGKLITVGGQPAATINSTITYQYNDKNFPVSMALDGSGINAFTYNCK